MSERQRITISGVLELLNQGKNRAEIGEHYNLNANQVRKIFQHPKLKGKKPRTQDPFVLVDDTEETVDAAATTDTVGAYDNEVEQDN
jgi:hypothetical protein